MSVLRPDYPFGCRGNCWCDTSALLIKEVGLDAMIDIYGKRLGKRLTTLCDLAQIDPKQLAKDLGITRVQMNNYLSGKQFPTGRGIISLHIIFGVTVGELLGTEPIASPPDPKSVRERLAALKNQ